MSDLADRMALLEERVTDLEASFDQQMHRDRAITHKLDQLAAGQVRLAEQVENIGTKVEHIDTAHGAALGAILDHLGIDRPDGV